VRTFFHHSPYPICSRGSGTSSDPPRSLLVAQPGVTEDPGQLGHDLSCPALLCQHSPTGSPYIPVDSWVYPAVLQLYPLGFVDNALLGMRPWPLTGVNRILDEVAGGFGDASVGQQSQWRRGARPCLTNYAMTSKALASDLVL
jgi:hypothetical protein